MRFDCDDKHDPDEWEIDARMAEAAAEMTVAQPAWPAWTSSEWCSVAHHLRVAAARYDDDAAVAREAAVKPGGAAQYRLVDQFVRQAQQARAMAQTIEEM
jgi:hypothetical protein